MHSEYALQRPAIPGYKVNVSSEELLMKRSALLMLGLFFGSWHRFLMLDRRQQVSQIASASASGSAEK
jgi:hypothetical protein